MHKYLAIITLLGSGLAHGHLAKIEEETTIPKEGARRNVLIVVGNTKGPSPR